MQTQIAVAPRRSRPARSGTAQGDRQKRLLDLPPKIERLLTLKPDHAYAEGLAEQVRSRLTDAAEKRLADYRYDEALQLLDHVAPDCRSPRSGRTSAAGGGVGVAELRSPQRPGRSTRRLWRSPSGCGGRRPATPEPRNCARKCNAEPSRPKSKGNGRRSPRRVRRKRRRWASPSKGSPPSAASPAPQSVSRRIGTAALPRPLCRRLRPGAGRTETGCAAGQFAGRRAAGHVEPGFAHHPIARRPACLGARPRHERTEGREALVE